MAVTLIFKNRERRQYGSEAPSKYVPAEKGRSAIYVMSDGALEEEEVDYIVEGMQEKEDGRKKVKRAGKEHMEKLVETVTSASPGERAKTLKEILGRGEG